MKINRAKNIDMTGVLKTWSFLENGWKTGFFGKGY